MTEEILKNNDKFIKKENTKREGGKARKPYNRKKKEFNNERNESITRKEYDWSEKRRE